jgi:hypothetical protein
VIQKKVRMTGKGDSGRLKRARVAGPGKRKGWRAIGAELDDLFYRKYDNLSSYFYYGNHSNGVK